jgi:MFS family permease
MCNDGICLLVSSTCLVSRLIIPRLFNVRTLQFLVSPYIGALSDKYGRRRILLITMIGNILSAVVFVLLNNFLYPSLMPIPQMDPVDFIRLLHAVSCDRRTE